MQASASSRGRCGAGLRSTSLIEALESRLLLTTTTIYPQPNLASLSYLTSGYDYSLTVNGANCPDYEFNNRGKYISSTDPNYSHYDQSFNCFAFAAFAFSGGNATIVVSPKFAITSFKILPMDAGITGTVSNNQLSIALASPKKFLVEFNGNTDWPLNIFADPPEVNPPAPGPNTLYYPAGVTDIGNYTIPANIDTVYLAPGAIVRGSLNTDNTSRSNLTILGRGMLYNGDAGWQNGVNAIRVSGVTKFTLQDIMVVGGSYHNIAVMDLPNTTIDNIKIIDPFWYNSDGIQLGDSPGSVVNNCYIYNDDDAIVLYNGERATNNIVSNPKNGSAVLVDAWGTYPQSDDYIDHLYIMHGQSLGGGSTPQCAIEVIAYDASPLNNVVFTNIYAENITAGAFTRIMSDKRYTDTPVITGYSPGKMTDILFQNVYLHDNTGGYIHGYDADRNVSYVYFNNFNVWNGSGWVQQSTLAGIGVTTNAYVNNIYFNTPTVFLKGDQNAYVPTGSNLPLTVDTHYFSDIGKTIKSIELWVDGVYYTSETSPATGYTFTITSIPLGSHMVFVRVGTTDGSWYQSQNYRYEAKAVNQLVLNGGFEYGKNGSTDPNGDRDWYKTKNGNVTFTTSTTVKHSGSKSLLVGGRAAVTDGPIQPFLDQLRDWFIGTNATQGNHTITFSAWVRNASGTSNMRMDVYYYDWGSTTQDPQILYQSSNVSVGTTWTHLTYSLTLDLENWNLVGHFITDMELGFEDSNATAQYYLDDVSITVATPVVPVTVTGLTINDGSAQRSMISDLTVTLSQYVTASPGAFSVLRRDGSSAAVVTATPVGLNAYELTFSGTGVVSGSLPDGSYTVSVNAAAVQGITGGTMAGNYTSSRFYRLFGDFNGDRQVDTADLAVFRQALNNPAGYLWYMDYEGNGVIDNTDYLQMRARLLKPLLR